MREVKLLLVDSQSDYALVDANLLNKQGIKLFFVSSDREKESKIVGKGVICRVASFDSSEMFRVTSEILPDFIVGFSEELFVDLSKIRQQFGIPGMSKDSAEFYSNKSKMYKHLNGKIPIPQTCDIDEKDTYNVLADKISGDKIFIKPSVGSGSQEIYKVSSVEDYESFLLNKVLGLKSYIAQKYIEADLYHSEVIIQRGEIRFISARKYTLPNAEMVLSKRPIFSTEIESPSLKRKIKEFSSSIAANIGLKNGVMHTEFFDTGDRGFVFIETNLRPPGIGLNVLYERLLGVSLETVLCLIVCGLEIPTLNVADENFFCGYYPLEDGTVHKINHLDLEVYNEWNFFVREGDIVKHKKHMSKAAMVLCSDESYEKLRRAEEVIKKHRVIEFDAL